MSEQASVHPSEGHPRLDLQNMELVRVIAHQLHDRDDTGAPVVPTLSNNLSDLPDEAISELEDRIVKALGKNTQSLPIVFNDTDGDSFFALATSAIATDEGDDFIMLSKQITELLAEAQKARPVPGGIVLVMQVKLHMGSTPALLVMKAEYQTGFSKKQTKRDVVIEVLRDLFLTKNQALYKVVLVSRYRNRGAPQDDQTPENYAAWLFDSNLARSTSKLHAAQYFLVGFLGAGIADTTATKTFDFYRQTQRFANEADLSDEHRLLLVNNVSNFLGRPDLEVFTVEEFAESNLPAEVRTAYKAHMASAGLPTHGISKNTELVERAIKSTELEFTSNVKLKFPSAAFGEYISIVSREGNYTTIRVAGQLKRAK